MHKIALVTDTSCDLPPEVRKDHNIFLASMKVHFGEEEYTDQVTITHEEFYRKMAENPDILPRTTQPQAKDFIELYQHMYREGYNTVLSLHISSNEWNNPGGRSRRGMMKKKRSRLFRLIRSGWTTAWAFVYLVGKRSEGEKGRKGQEFHWKLARQKDLILWPLP